MIGIKRDDDVGLDLINDVAHVGDHVTERRPGERSWRPRVAQHTVAWAPCSAARAMTDPVPNGTVYRITPVGREALRGWLAEPSEPTHIESEAALKVFFADQAGTTELRATITGIRHDAASALERLGAMAAGEHEFPERTATNVLSMRLVTDLHETLYRWAEWADTAVNVLEKADRRAIQRQTQDVLHAISASRAGLR